ncbi:hypothetical protein [uncultured Marivirga sp.]|mgnify:CR=1 FL=1|uniref:hypothetical protein n=1 Tax=uncultured Marivirga sp. TaxID=1123707 RepID=UPI0030EEBE81|tara:strand:+ start:4302 stop:5609 length:1308 start_codon:yes stop_codon:yes gene_type:complete
MVRLFLICFLIFHLFSLHVFAQKQLKSIEKLSEHINTEAEEILPLLSPSGDSLFFARVFHESNKGGKYSGSDIWLSTFGNTAQNWAIANNDLKDWNDKRNNFIIGINPHEKIIYQNNPKDPDKGIRFVKKISNYWTKPEDLAIPGIPNSGYQGIYVSPDYSVILFSMKTIRSFGKEDLYVSTKDNQGGWTEPVNLGTTINTSNSEISPFLSSDKKTLFFASAGHGGFGDMDIFMAQRLYNSWTVWSKPQNLGNQINSTAFDGYYSEYGDSIAFFSSNRGGELSDIFEARYVRIEEKNALNQTVKISTAQQKANRVYINEDNLSSDYGIPSDFRIEVSLNKALSENSLIKEQLWFLAGKLNRYSNLKVAFAVVPTTNIPSDILVIQSNKIMAELFSEFTQLKVSRSKIEYDGIELRGNLENGLEQMVQIVPLFFKE